MGQPGGKLPVGRLWFAALLCAGAWFAPAPARADCAHDAISQTHPPADLSRFEPLVLAGVMAPVADPPAAGPHQRPARCPGGLCSRGQDLPLVPVSDPPAVKHWVVLTAWLVPRAAAWSAWPCDDPPARVGHQGLGVFHPPEFSSHHASFA